MVALNLNLGNVEASIGAAVVIKSEGWHSGAVQKTEQKNTDKGQGKNAFLEVTIAYQDGTTFVQRYNLWNDNPDTVRIAYGELAALCDATGTPRAVQDTNQFNNIPFDHYLSVEQTEYNGKKITVNRLKAVKDRNGKVIGTVPQAATGAPTPNAAPNPAPQAGAPGGFAAPGGFGAPQGQQAPAPQPQMPQPGQGFPTPGQGQAPQPQQQMPQQGAAPQPWGQGAPQPNPGFPTPGQGQAAPQPGGFGGGGFPTPQGGPWGGPQQ